MLAAAAQGEGGNSGGLGGKLQAARGSEGKLAADLSHHTGEAGLAQALLHGL